MDEDQLLLRFVATFAVFEDLVAWDRNVPPELDDGCDDSAWAHPRWKPAAIKTPRSELVDFYAAAKVKFPPLYERLVLSYRWLEVELPEFASLYANPPGPMTSGLLQKIVGNLHCKNVLLPAGLVPFGLDWGGGSDFVCFDMSLRKIQRDCPVLLVEHESVYCRGCIGETRQLAKSFWSFAEQIIDKAEA